MTTDDTRQEALVDHLREIASLAERGLTTTVKEAPRRLTDRERVDVLTDELIRVRDLLRRIGEAAEDAVEALRDFAEEGVSSDEATGPSTECSGLPASPDNDKENFA